MATQAMKDARRIEQLERKPELNDDEKRELATLRARQQTQAQQAGGRGRNHLTPHPLVAGRRG